MIVLPTPPPKTLWQHPLRHRLLAPSCGNNLLLVDASWPGRCLPLGWAGLVAPITVRVHFQPRAGADRTTERSLGSKPGADASRISLRPPLLNETRSPFQDTRRFARRSVGGRAGHAKSRRFAEEAPTSRHKKDLAGIRILYLLPGAVSSHIDISAVLVERTKDVAWLAGNRFGVGQIGIL